MSRARLAELVRVDVTAVNAWERDKYQPRVEKRLRLAKAFGIKLEELSLNPGAHIFHSATIETIHSGEDFAQTLFERTARTEREICTIQCSRVGVTAVSKGGSFGRLISQRILDDTIAFNRVEMVFDLSRLQELAHNLFRYRGHAYRVAVYRADLDHSFPDLNAFLFDNKEVLLGRHSSRRGAQKRPALSISNDAFANYIRQMWSDADADGVVLSADSSLNLVNIRKLATDFGLAEGDWPSFLEGARRLRAADGVPPLP